MRVKAKKILRRQHDLLREMLICSGGYFLAKGHKGWFKAAELFKRRKMRQRYQKNESLFENDLQYLQRQSWADFSPDTGKQDEYGQHARGEASNWSLAITKDGILKCAEEEERTSFRSLFKLASWTIVMIGLAGTYATLAQIYKLPLPFHGVMWHPELYNPR